MQEALASVVFQRTPRASEMLRKSPDEVPRRLRTLLLAIDGRSSVEQYVPFLPNQTPLSPKLRELETMGLLQRKGEPAPVVKIGADSPPASMPIQLPVVSATSGELDYVTLLAIEVLFQPQAPISPTVSRSGGAPGERPTLRGVLSEMERFVARFKGMEGLPLTLMFEQIRSVQQLRAELPDYARLLAPYGSAAEHHLALIRWWLDRMCD
ncbi:MAG: hypothetical protein ACOYNB_05675 [Aquabacterium sp.]|uniref:hypothetical protein n=1 Tax=Aquabacterium sp. TaxID=1872578 RepID=UPI003BD99345